MHTEVQQGCGPLLQCQHGVTTDVGASEACNPAWGGCGSIAMVHGQAKQTPQF